MTNKGKTYTLQTRIIADQVFNMNELLLAKLPKSFRRENRDDTSKLFLGS